ncbi:helix-turn-helix domain-containing protein [Paludisphaera sp.]|uniref:helix-turn-helix domain-containing protein n=1 Tax=Paludisphaera sp. TaxID=2017432 RepID=UPI00301BE9D5
MDFRLKGSARDRLRSMAKRPRSRKQLYRAEALLELDEGRPIEEVARRHRVGVEKVEAWVEAFAERGLAFLDEPDAGRPPTRDDGDSGRDDP